MQISEHTPHPVEELPPTRAQKLLKALTSYYFIALVIAAACACLFGWLADEVLEHEFTAVNTAILLKIHTFRTPTLDEIALTITWLGSVPGIATIGIILALGQLLLKRYVDLATFAAVLVGAAVMVFSFKLFFHQTRPQVFVPLVHEKDFSFPSGHSLTSFSLWGFFAWWIVSMGHREYWRWFLAILGILVAAMVALSRLYIGVHWPTDVFAGMLLGFAWVGVCTTGQHWLTRHARRERRLALAKSQNLGLRPRRV